MRHVRVGSTGSEVPARTSAGSRVSLLAVGADATPSHFLTASYPALPLTFLTRVQRLEGVCATRRRLEMKPLFTSASPAAPLSLKHRAPAKLVLGSLTAQLVCGEAVI